MSGNGAPVKPNRTIEGIAWCWQDKKALRKIRDAFDRTNDVQSALAVYVALTEIASDEQSDTFTTTHSWIAQRSGCSPRTVASRLPELAAIRLVKIWTPALRAPSTFTLLPVLQPLHSVLQQPKKAPLQALEESPEECTEEKGKKAPAVASQGNGKGKQPTPGEYVAMEKRLPQIQKEIEELKNSCEGHNDLSPKDKAKLTELRRREAKIEKTLDERIDSITAEARAEVFSEPPK